jgi:DinB superfamily
MDERDRQGHLETLGTTAGRLKAALTGVPRRILLWTPAPGKWSIHEVVCHMRDMEREAYLERYRRILAEDNPTLPDVDGDRRAIEGGYRSLKLPEVLRDWRGLRKECLRALKGAKGSQWERIGTHETAGPVSMNDLVARQAVGNDSAHLAQIEAIKRRYEVLALLGDGPRALAEMGRGLSRETLGSRPASGKWAAVEIGCHLRDIERVYAERFTKMAFGERPSFWMLDNDAAADRLGYRDADWTATVKEFKRLREDTVSLLRALPHASWRRTGLHPKRGELTIEELARVLADHDRKHFDRIRETVGGSGA